MPATSIARALDAAAELTDLLRLAHSAVHRVHVEVSGDAHSVAGRLSEQLEYLRRVADVLRHETERLSRQQGAMESATVRVPLTLSRLSR